MPIFDEIIGHDRQKRILTGAFTRSRVPTTYLFTGESGIGKRALAVEFGRLLNCLSPVKGQEGPDACGECSHCERIKKGVHPDFRMVTPEDGMIRIEQVRDLIEFLSLKALEAQYKIIIIDEAERMNPAASNAFLKTLEEPPEGSLIILVTSLPDQLLDTVRSRCFQVRFTPLSRRETEMVLERIGIEGARKRERLAMLLQGCPGRVLEEEDQTGVTEDEILTHLLPPVKPVRWKDRNEMEEWLRKFILMIRDVAVSGVGIEREEIFMNRKIGRLKDEKSSLIPLERALCLYEETTGLLNDLGYNINHLIAGNYLTYLLREYYGDTC
jgi:DNA polymerase-3 subunit delta'